MIASISIADRHVGSGQPVFIVAEAGVNHNGDINLALRLIEAAAEAGADAIKFQTWRTELEVTREGPKAAYQLQTTSQAESQFDMIRKLELPPQAFQQLRDHAATRGLIFFSTPFDIPSVDVLAALDVPVFKVPSGEITNFPLLRKVGAAAKPVILSTGMSTLGEIELAIACLQAAGTSELILLHCLSNYPAPLEESNLRAMQTLAAAFQRPVGFSDHTLGNDAVIAAVALGATVVEKHLTLDRSLPGPDHQASVDPAGFRAYVTAIRLIEQALGDGIKRPMPSEMDVRAVARRSIVAAHDLAAGTRLAETDLLMKRPGTGLESINLPKVIGRTTRRALVEDELLAWSDLEPE